jgi:hypothetical protein
MMTSGRRPLVPLQTISDPRLAVEVVLGERERFVDAQAAAPDRDS